MRLCILCVPRGRCLKCVCGAAWEGAESNQWMQSGMGEGVYRGGGV